MSVVVGRLMRVRNIAFSGFVDSKFLTLPKAKPTKVIKLVLIKIDKFRFHLIFTEPDPLFHFSPTNMSIENVL